MLLALAYCNKDSAQAQALLKWVADLGGCKPHDCVLVADAAVPWPTGKTMRDLALPSFQQVSCISNGHPVEGWIAGSVSLFKSAAVFAKGQPFFWLEPDAVPLRAGWFSELVAAYAACGKPYLGAMISHHAPKFPNPYMEGCAFYPADCWDKFSSYYDPEASWVKWDAPVVVPNAVNTPLIQHMIGEQANPPRFDAHPEHNKGVFCLADLDARACLFHRTKDPALIRLLRAKLSLPEKQPTTNLLVVLPFCERDARMFAKNLDWMAQLGGRYPNSALLSWDIGTTPGAVKLVRDAAGKCFANIFQTTYPTPRRGQWAPTMAFIHAANYAQRFGKPWLWMEYDAVPIKPDWLEVLEGLYVKGGQPFAGPVVPNLGHVNGTSIYPPNTPGMLREAFTHTETAWDVAAKKEMAGRTTNLHPVYFHTWGVHQGKLHPFLGDSPDFANDALFRQIPPEAVIAHRSKDGHLIDRLRNGTK